MKRIETGSPDCLAYSSASGGAGLIFGLLFFAAAWGMTKVPIEGGPPWATSAVVAGLVALGVFCATCCHGFEINREVNRLTTWFGFLIPWFRRNRELDIQSVRLTRDCTRRKGVTHYHYNILLGFPQRELCVGIESDGIHAFSVSQEIANFLGLPLQDDSVDS